jgi:hypothetical protein
MSTKALYIQGLENHQDLLQVNHDLVRAGNEMLNSSRTGNEDFVSAMKGLGNGLLTLGGWAGGKTIDAFSHVIGAAGAGLTRAFSDNETLIKKLLQNFSKIEDHELNLSKSTVALITASGDIEDISKDMDVLIRMLDVLDKHSKDMLSYLDKQLIIAKKLKGVKTADAIFAVVDEFHELKYPVFGLPHHSGDKYTSEELPGGKTWEFAYNDGKSPKYIMNGDTPAGGGSSITFSKAEVSALLNKLDKVNSMHKRVKQSYDSYLSFLRSWSDMVKSVDGNLGSLDKVSGSAMAEAEKILAGEPNALAFYSGFTPRVVSFTDRYIHGVLGVFA